MIIDGLHVTSWWPCWWKETIRFFSSESELTLSLTRVPYGTKSHYVPNIESICIKFGHQTDLGEICAMEA